MKCPGVILKHKSLYTPFWSVPGAKRLNLILLQLASGFGVPRSECIYCLCDPQQMSGQTQLHSRLLAHRKGVCFLCSV